MRGDRSETFELPIFRLVRNIPCKGDKSFKVGNSTLPGQLRSFKSLNARTGEMSATFLVMNCKFSNKAVLDMRLHLPIEPRIQFHQLLRHRLHMLLSGIACTSANHAGKAGSCMKSLEEEMADWQAAA